MENHSRSNKAGTVLGLMLDEASAMEAALIAPRGDAVKGGSDRKGAHRR